jgi:Ca2+-transporting ATPase
MLALVTNVPFLQDAFGTTSLSPEEWLRVAGLALLIVPVLETAKWLLRRGRLGALQPA